jgi:electron transfer flavoprotein alpha subunit
MNRYFTVILFAGSPRYEHDRKVISAFLQKSGLRPTCGTVLVLDGPPRMESVLDVLQDELLSDLVLFAPGADSEELAVRLSVRKGGTSMTDVLSVAEDLQAGCASADPDRSEPGVPAISIVRNVYNGHLTGTFTLEDGPFFLALDRSLPEADTQMAEDTCKLMPVKTMHFLPSEEDPLHGTDRQVLPQPEDTGLADAHFIIAGGRGLGSPAKAERFLELANQLGASTGGTRPAVMNGWLPLDRLIGVSGTLVHPDVCLVLGASGSAAFMAGIAQSKTIIAVNTDEKAPLARQADAFVQGDWDQILSALAALKK